MCEIAGMRNSDRKKAFVSTGNHGLTSQSMAEWRWNEDCSFIVCRGDNFKLEISFISSLQSSFTIVKKKKKKKEKNQFHCVAMQ